MKREEIEREQQKLMAEKQEIFIQVERALKEKEQAEARIIELDALLPKLLADIALKKIPSSPGMRQLVQNKRERGKQQRIIDRYEPLKIGLQAAGNKFRTPLRVLDRNTQWWNLYDKTKSEILANPHDRNHELREAKLRRLANHVDLNCGPDAEEFLKGLEKKDK